MKRAQANDSEALEQLLGAPDSARAEYSRARSEHERLVDAEQPPGSSRRQRHEPSVGVPTIGVRPFRRLN